MTKLPLAFLAVAVLGAVGCSTQHGAGDAAQSAGTIAASPSSTAPTSQPSAVSAVPGTNDNQYDTGPFTVTMKGIGPLPAQYDSVTEQGQTIAENCALVDVRNTSANFTGWVSPDVEFVKGHSLKGRVIGTAAGDPTGGGSGGQSDPLAPGQSELLYACPEGITGSVYAEAQIISVTYGTADESMAEATTVQLRY